MRFSSTQIDLDVAMECSGCPEYLHVLLLASACPDRPTDRMTLKICLKMSCRFFFPFHDTRIFPESSVCWALDGCRNLMCLCVEGLLTQHGITMMISTSFSGAYLHISNHMDCCGVHQLCMKKLNFFFCIAFFCKCTLDCTCYN